MKYTILQKELMDDSIYLYEIEVEKDEDLWEAVNESIATNTSNEIEVDLGVLKKKIKEFEAGIK